MSADSQSKGGTEATVRLAKRDPVPTEVNLRTAYSGFSELERAQARRILTEVLPATNIGRVACCGPSGRFGRPPSGCPRRSPWYYLSPDCVVQEWLISSRRPAPPADR